MIKLKAAGVGFRLALLGVFLAWVGLRVVYWNGYYTEDSPGYVGDAISVVLRAYQARHDVNGLNVGTYLPVALPIAVFGKAEFALSIWPLFCSLLGMASIGAVTGILFGRAFGLLGAFLYAVYPGDVFFSTVVMPDSIQAGWLSFSIFLIVYSFVVSKEKRPATLVAAGIVMGGCHLIRANGFLLLPIALCSTAILSRTWNSNTAGAVLRDCLLLAAGWVLVSVMEASIYLLATHDALLRFHVVSDHYGTMGSIQQWGLNRDLRTIPFSVFAPALWWIQGGWGRLNEDQAYHGLLFCWALVSLVLIGLSTILPSKDGRPARDGGAFAIAAIWFLWPLLYHEFGSQSLRHFVPIHRLSRHLVVYAPGAIFATVAGCYVIAKRASRWRRGGWAVLATLVCLVLPIHLYFNWAGVQISYTAYHRIKGRYVRIWEHLPASLHAIAADPGDLGFFDFWLNPLGAERVRMTALDGYSSCRELSDVVVFTRSNPGWDRLSAAVIQEDVKRLPCLIDPPAGWKLLYDGYPERIYAIGRPK